MIVPDINLLLYAVVSGFPQHRRARSWWEQSVNTGKRIGLTHPAIFGFLRIVTSARVLHTPLAVPQPSATCSTGWPNRTSSC